LCSACEDKQDRCDSKGLAAHHSAHSSGSVKDR
jgi:hypothetical protein